MGALSTRRFCENKTRKYGRVCAAALLISTANTNTAHDRWERHAGVTTWTACVEWQCHRPETRDAVGRLLLWVRAGGEGGGGCGAAVWCGGSRGAPSPVRSRALGASLPPRRRRRPCRRRRPPAPPEAAPAPPKAAWRRQAPVGPPPRRGELNGARFIRNQTSRPA